MTEHRLYLNLADNGWMVARCGCGGWQKERMLGPTEQASEVARELEREFRRHAGLDPTPPHTPAPPTG